MNKKKIKIIEDYIFAKTLNLIAQNTIVPRENEEISNLISYAKDKSEKLLKLNFIKINKLKLNNLSLLILNKELESANIYNNQEQNILKIKEMLKKEMFL